MKPTLLLLLGVALAMSSTLAGCDDGNSAWRAKHREQDARLADLDADIAELKADIADLETIRAENAELRTKNAELERQFEELRGQLEAVQQPIEDTTDAASVRRCSTHLWQLAALYTTKQMERPGLPKYDGSALLLYYRQKGLIQNGDEEVLLCDLDPLALRPGGEVESDAWDKADLKAPPRGLCSYPFRAWRSHPLSPDAPTLQAIGCCPHHPEGAVVAYEDGSVRLVTREDLGIPPGEAIEVGPGSRAELLRPLVYRTR